MYIGDYAGRRALYTPDALAVIDTGREPHARFTYAQLNDRANRLANALRMRGVRQGDRVALIALNGVEYLDAFFACGKLGAVFVPISWRLHPREWDELIARAHPKVILASPEFAASIEASDTWCLLLDEIGNHNHLSDWGSYRNVLMLASPAPVLTEAVADSDTACLIFTGGTTGTPKGAQISHGMIAWNTLNTIIHDLQHGDVTVNSFPMFHTGGLLVYVVPLLILGGTVVLTRRFEAAHTLDLLQQYRATVYAAVPTMYQLMTTAGNWTHVDLSSLRFCTSGGSPLPIPLIEHFAREKGVRFKQGFGMSEFGPGAFALAAEDAISKAGSVGRPNFFVDARIVDDRNQPQPPGVVGELVLRGRSMASGYDDDPEATRAAIDAAGWFHTGDLARMDEAGYFTIVDRKKDMFISGGENVYPAEIEQALYTHPAVAQCAVIGMPDARWGEVGKAFVVLRPTMRADADELIAHVRDRLASFKVPRAIVFRDSLPTSAAGKILKRDLKAEADTQGE